MFSVPLASGPVRRFRSYLSASNPFLNSAVAPGFKVFQPPIGPKTIAKKLSLNRQPHAEFYLQAIEKDPNYALAYVGLADCYSLRAGYVSPRKAFPEARKAALKALELDDTLGEAHASIAYIKYFYDWDWTGSEKELQRAISLNPNYADSHTHYASLLSHVGRPEEAIVEARRAVALDPLSALANRFLGAVLYYARQYDQALEQERKALELDPNFLEAYRDIGAIYLRKSMNKEAIEELERASAIAPEGTTTTLSFLGNAYALVGRKGDAEKVLARLNALSATRWVPPESWARVYIGLGDKDKAFEWLEKDYEERFLANLALWGPMYDSIRSDVRFADLLRRMNLQP
jgi:tetratricopeptide (TPR) repeat protein